MTYKIILWQSANVDFVEIMKKYVLLTIIRVIRYNIVRDIMNKYFIY